MTRAFGSVRLEANIASGASPASPQPESHRRVIMSSSFNFNESRPTLVSPHRPAERLPAWRRATGCLFLVLALVLLGASAGLVLTAPAPAPAGADGGPAAAETTETSETAATASEAPQATNTDQPSGSSGGSLLERMPQRMPTLSSAQIIDLLATPPQILAEEDVMAITGLSYDPFTIVSERSRSRMTSYTVARGDTIDSISTRFGLRRETIAWCNSYRKAQILFTGDILTIPPADGACHTVIASQGKDISAIAEQYDIADPFLIIDSPANDLPEISPDTQLPSSTRLFIPGGVGPIITWNAAVEEDASGNVIAFARGHPNSCGAVAGGGSFWTNPLPNGSFVRGFYAGHSGIDISAANGTPILAANGGPVLYAGWNSWGYGNTVVIGHGPFSTLYGHMNSLAVRCGNFVAAGQVIGYVGSTGNSSGPHLHFEIRYRNEPQDPSATIGIGW